MNQKVVITGAGGFIGAFLTQELIKKGYKVHAFVRSKKSLWRLNDVLSEIKVFEDLLNNKVQLKKTLKKINPTYVFHLATYGAYPTQQEIDKMIKTNIVGTTNLLEALNGLSCKAIVVAGSSSEYGKKEKQMKETDYLEPNNFYGATKAAQTQISQVYGITSDLPIIILRLFNVYGPYEEKGRLVRSVIESVLSKKEIALATGKETRDFIYVEDVVDVFIRAAKSQVKSGSVFNVGTGKQTTIRELAENVIDIAGVKVPIKLNVYPGRKWDTTHWRASIRKTSKVLKWKPKYTLKKGLEKTIKWYTQN